MECTGSPLGDVAIAIHFLASVILLPSAFYAYIKLREAMRIYWRLLPLGLVAGSMVNLGGFAWEGCFTVPAGDIIVTVAASGISLWFAYNSLKGRKCLPCIYKVERMHDRAY
jgi:hypothetical protein